MKNWMVILILALAGGVWGQGGMLLVGGAAAPPPPGQLLLDEYPDAAAAYSLRKLRAGYTGNCIQVRRSDTNALADIGFVSDYLDTMGLKAFCPVGVDCFVSIWYDQAGNNVNVFQNENNFQPKIVTNGVINKMGVAPAIRFNGVNTILQSNIIVSYTGVHTVFIIYNYINPNPQFPYVYDHGTQRYILRPTNRVQNIFEGINLVAEAYVSQARYLSYALFNGNNSVLNVNNTSYTGSTGSLTSASTRITLGRDAGSSSITPLNGNIQEFITYRNNQSANQASIRSNINSFYSVY